jgi:small neutral amino acid transporter SnatA (MarC family)
MHASSTRLEDSRLVSVTFDRSAVPDKVMLLAAYLGYSTVAGFEIRICALRSVGGPTLAFIHRNAGIFALLS